MFILYHFSIHHFDWQEVQLMRFQHPEQWAYRNLGIEIWGSKFGDRSLGIPKKTNKKN
jgi:hypothetical protein